MKKTKIFMISALALVMAASLAFGVAAIKSAPSKVDADSTIRVYYINENSWSNVYIHHWKEEGSSTTWPGEAMTQIEGKLYYADIDSAHDCVIFHNNSGTQTENITGVLDCNVYRGLDTVPTYNVAGTTTIYFYNDADWSEIYYYVFREEAGKFKVEKAAWSGEQIASEVVGHEGWYSVEVDNLYDKIIFNNGLTGGDAKQTSDLAVAEKYYYKDTAYDSYEDAATAKLIEDKKAEMASDPGYYILDSTVGFNYSETKLTAPGSDGNKAEIDNFTFTAGVGYKIVHVDNTGYWTWFDWDTDSLSNKKVVSFDKDANGVAKVTGKVNIFVNGSDTVYVSYVENLNMSSVKFKFSVSEDYVIFVAAFDLNEVKGDGSYTIGFLYDGVVVSSGNVYYTSIDYGTGAKDAKAIFGDGCEGYGLIVCEVETDTITLGKTATAFIKNGDDVVDAVVSGTIAVPAP